MTDDHEAKTELARKIATEVARMRGENTRLKATIADLVKALEDILAHPRTDDRSIVFMPREVAAARAALEKAKQP